MPARSSEFPEPESPDLRRSKAGWRRRGKPASNRVLGMMVDAFAGFATLDGRLAPGEADLILDLLRSAYPEADHSWLARRVQRAVRNPKPLANTAAELRELLEDPEKMAVGLQLYTLVDAVGRTERSRSAFEVFMRRLGRPDHAHQILDEMGGLPLGSPVGFERIIFAHHPNADVQLPANVISGIYDVRILQFRDGVVFSESKTNIYIKK
ncbi:MAG: TIGR02186 family protein, partial [Haloferula sp.]